MENPCVGCGVDLGPQNPRQLCGKTWCPQMRHMQSPSATQRDLSQVSSISRSSSIFALPREKLSPEDMLTMLETMRGEMWTMLEMISTLSDYITSSSAASAAASER